MFILTRKIINYVEYDYFYQQHPVYPIIQQNYQQTSFQQAQMSISSQIQDYQHTSNSEPTKVNEASREMNKDGKIQTSKENLSPASNTTHFNELSNNPSSICLPSISSNNPSHNPSNNPSTTPSINPSKNSSVLSSPHNISPTDQLKQDANFQPTKQNTCSNANSKHDPQGTQAANAKSIQSTYAKSDSFAQNTQPNYQMTVAAVAQQMQPHQHTQSQFMHSLDNYARISNLGHSGFYPQTGHQVQQQVQGHSQIAGFPTYQQPSTSRNLDLASRYDSMIVPMKQNKVNYALRGGELKIFSVILTENKNQRHLFIYNQHFYYRSFHHPASTTEPTPDHSTRDTRTSTPASNLKVSQ